MPTMQEITEIAAFRGVPEHDLFRDSFQEEGLNLNPDLIRKRWPIGKPTNTGKVSGRPNLCWAIEREIDARLEILWGPDKESLPELDRVMLQSEMRGLSLTYSMYTGRSVEMCSVAAMERFMERKKARELGVQV